MAKANFVGVLRARGRLHCTDGLSLGMICAVDDLSEHMAKAFVGLQGWSIAYRDGDSWWFNKESDQYVSWSYP